MLKNIQLNVKNLSKMRSQPPEEYAAIRFDSNNNCNVHCVYCHNARSDELIDPGEFQSFLEQNVISADYFQIGCIMEPTLDPRLCDFMQIVASSPAKPKKAFRLQTNGILLHRHDFARMRDVGLSVLAVSVDSATSSTHKLLRGGTSLPKVQGNISAFHRACPAIEMMMLTTVTSANVDDVAELVLWGIDLGIKRFELRQMFYYPDSNIVDHKEMPSLIVTEKEFADLREGITAKFGNSAKILFYGNNDLVATAKAIKAASLIASPPALF